MKVTRPDIIITKVREFRPRCLYKETFFFFNVLPHTDC